MRSNAKTLGMTLMLLAACAATTAWAGSLNGEIKLGGIFKDETVGDVSAMPETFNIYEGFSFSRVKLAGQAGQKNFFTLDLNEINQKSGRGMFGYRVPNLLNLTLRYDQHRQIYDAAGDVTSRRKNMRGSLVLTPSKVWRIAADFGDQRKTGERMAYPSGTASFLGNMLRLPAVHGPGRGRGPQGQPRRGRRLRVLRLHGREPDRRRTPGRRVLAAAQRQRLLHAVAPLPLPAGLLRQAGDDRGRHRLRDGHLPVPGHGPAGPRLAVQVPVLRQPRRRQVHADGDRQPAQRLRPGLVQRHRQPVRAATASSPTTTTGT